MEDFLSTFLRKDLPPHGHCYLWNEDLVNLHVASDAIIVLSYFTIPFALIYLVLKRDDLRFNYMFVMFSIFIFACGVTHLMNIYNVWNGAYWVSGAIKAVTAAASVGTAILVWPLIPKALALPSNETLRQLNSELQSQSELAIKQSRDLEALSRRLATMVEERNRELEQLKQVKAALLQSNSDLEHSNQALQQFTYIASHDLKEPLRTITSFGQLLKRSAADKLSDKDQEIVHFMTDAASRMSELLEALRSYSAIGKQSEGSTNVDLTAATEQIISDLGTSIEKNAAKITVEPIGEAHVKRHHVQPLIQNLISNAIKFCPNERTPVIEIGPAPNTKPDEVGFYVRDNGIGIEQEFHDKIFGVFERLHGRKEFEGTGMGLAICQKIVESNHGRIEVESTPGEGTEFRIYLPAATATLDA